MLCIKILYPAHRPDIAYLSEIPLGDGKARMVQDHLANDFDGSVGTGGMIDFHISSLNQK